MKTQTIYSTNFNFMKRFLTFCVAALTSVVIMAQEAVNDGFLLTQNVPNPFNGTTRVYLSVDQAGEAMLVIADISGKTQATWRGDLETGVYAFDVSLRTQGTYVMGALMQGKKSSIVLFCDNGGQTNRIEFVGWVDAIHETAYQNVTAFDSEEEFVGYAEKHPSTAPASAKNFRVALSLSPFSLNQFEAGYTFLVGDEIATTPEELQQIFMDYGSTEMYVRVATKRHKTYNPDGSLDNTTDGKKDENANVHTFDQVMQSCRIAAALDIPINPEIMCAYIYMDMDGTQAPRFYPSDYPELYAKPEFAAIMKDGDPKIWETLSLADICKVLEIYGEWIADSILATGVTVNDWNLGNEANFGFAGIGIGTPNSFDQKLAKAGPLKRYMASLFSVWWLKKHVWCYEAQTLAAVQRGIRKAYTHYPMLDASQIKFSTHIATVVSTPRASASFFTYMTEHGYDMQTAGISYYPSAPAMSFNKKSLLTKTVTRINKKCNMEVFIGEFSYPSQDMVGPFAGWNKQLVGYPKTQHGQAEIYRDVIAWGKAHGMAGIRYWAPDYEGEWYPMSMFEFQDKVGVAKEIMVNHNLIVK